MITVASCCCFKLETGVKIIAWLLLIGAVLLSLISAFYIFAGLSCKADGGAFCSIIMLFSFVFLLLCIGTAFIALQCIKGTETHDHSKLKPMLILFGFAAALSPLQILLFTVVAVCQALVGFVINGYCFVVVYSLYDVFRREYESSGNNGSTLQPQVAHKV